MRDFGLYVSTSDGDKVAVTDIEIEKLAKPILVYNLEVEDFNTYFVGEYGVLVHNTYKTDLGKPHKTPNVNHNNAIEDTLTAMESIGAEDLMKNKQQVNALLEKVSKKMPDVAFTYDGIRYNFNFISNPQSSSAVRKEIQAYLDILLADPDAATWLFFDY